jgi:hypothetical protein
MLSDKSFISYTSSDFTLDTNASTLNLHSRRIERTGAAHSPGSFCNPRETASPVEIEPRADAECTGAPAEEEMPKRRRHNAKMQAVDDAVHGAIAVAVCLTAVVWVPIALVAV